MILAVVKSCLSLPRSPNSPLSLVCCYPMSFTYPCPRKLRELMKMSLIQRQSPTTVRQIWHQYHQSRPANIADTLTKQQYTHLTNKANHAPLFMLPLHRQAGHFKLLTQYQENCFVHLPLQCQLVTYLEDYKRYGRNAAPYMVITLFTELLFTKGIVLVRNDIINSLMSAAEAKKTWEWLQVSYFEGDNYEIVDKFNHQAQQFDLNRYNQLYNCS